MTQTVCELAVPASYETPIKWTRFGWLLLVIGFRNKLAKENPSAVSSVPGRRGEQGRWRAARSASLSFAGFPGFQR